MFKLKLKIAVSEEYNSFLIKQIAHSVLKKLPLHEMDFHLLFFPLNNKKEILEKAHSLFGEDLSEDEWKRFEAAVKEESTSFSWGTRDVEVVVLMISDDETFVLTNPEAMTGLIVHEVVHSIQRQWGIEDMLKQIFRVDDAFFEQLAQIELENYPKDVLVNILREYTILLYFVIKEFYCNQQVIQLGFANELFLYYYHLFSSSCPLPGFTVHYQAKRTIKSEELSELLNALTMIITTLPAWVPFYRVRLKRIYGMNWNNLYQWISKCYTVDLPILTREIGHILDLYLTAFNYERSFPMHFLSFMYTLLFKTISGRSFVFAHITNALDVLETLPLAKEEEEYMLIPLLKSAHVVAEKEIGGLINRFYCQEVEKMLQERLPKDEWEEWIHEGVKEFAPENLLRIPLYLVYKKIRTLLLSAKSWEAREFALVFSHIEAALKELNDQACWECSYKAIGALRTLFRYGTPKRSKICHVLLPHEVELKSMLGLKRLTTLEVHNMIETFILFRVPFDPTLVDRCMEIVELLKTTKDKLEGLSEKDTADTLALLLLTFKWEDPTNPLLKEKSSSIVRIALFTAGITPQIIRLAVPTFYSLLHSQETEETEEVPENTKPTEKAKTVEKNSE